MVVRMIVWTLTVRSGEAAIQYRKGMGTETTHWRVGTQGMTHSTRWAAVWAIRRAAHDGQNPRRLQLKASNISAYRCHIPGGESRGRGCHTKCLEHFPGRYIGYLALPANAAHQPLGNHDMHCGSNQKRVDTQVQQPGNGG